MVKGRLARPSPNRGKRVTTPESAPNWDDFPPIFSFDHMASSHNVETCDRRERLDLLNAIWTRSRVTWRELRSVGRHQLGAEPIRRINHPLPAVVTEDTTLLAFRFSGQKAMVGFREGRIFHVVWLDTEFEVYDH